MPTVAVQSLHIGNNVGFLNILQRILSIAAILECVPSSPSPLLNGGDAGCGPHLLLQ